MKPIGWLFVLLPLFLTGPAAAEFYKYIDQSGSIRFTDDINRVPREQREKLKIYEESKPVMEKTAPVKTEPPVAEAAPEKIPVPTGEVNENQLRTMQEALERKKSDLADQYRGLQQEREALESRRSQIQTQEEADQFKSAVQRLNEKIAAYEQKRKAFDAQAESYGRLNAQFAETAQPEKVSPGKPTQ